MLRLLKRRAEFQRKAGEIYGAIVTQARQPVFYARLGIPDTPTGRYEMVVVHLFLVLERLRGEGPLADALAQELVDAFVADMDELVARARHRRRRRAQTREARGGRLLRAWQGLPQGD